MTKPTDLSQTQHAACSPSNSTSHTKEDDLPSSDYVKNTAIPEDTAPVLETSTPKRSTNGSIDLEITQNLGVQENCEGTVQSWSPIDDIGKSLDDTSSFQKEQDDLKYKTGDGASSAVSETKPDLTNITSDMEKKPYKIEDWTKEHVCHWLVKEIKVPQQYADILYNEDVSGAALILFDKKDFLEAGLKHGPAVQILKNISQYNTSSKHDLEITPNLSIQENCDGVSNVQKWSTVSSYQEEKCHKRGEGSSTQSIHSTKPENSLNSPVICLCKPRPFDESCPTFEYTQKEFLPPETGPSNLIDAVHEYKLFTNIENASEEALLQKWTNDAFGFAAACMNSRTNGTIHFGVSDEPQGQIIGVAVKCQKKYVDAFDLGFEKHFEHNISILKACIRPPKFIKVKCPDNADKWVIEIDVVPMYELTGEKKFYSVLDKKRRKSKTFFIRDGASTTNYTPEKNPKRTKQNEKNLNDNVKLWALNRKLAEEWYKLRTRDVRV